MPGIYYPDHNLYLTGSNAFSIGIVDSMMSAVLATAVALRRPWKVMNIMSQAIRYSHQPHSQPSNAPQTKI
jgi:hypothetical protein